jgi:hypothetical protein
MAVKKKAVSFSVNIKTWEHCLKLKEQTGIVWSDVVEEALYRVSQTIQQTLDLHSSTDSMDQVVQFLTDSTTTTYLDSLSVLSEHSTQPTTQEPVPKVRSQSRSQVSKK